MPLKVHNRTKLFAITIRHHYSPSLFVITIRHHYSSSLFTITIHHHYSTSLFAITIRHHYSPILKLYFRCDMMQAMFTDDFIESSAKVVKFPGVTRYLYYTIKKTLLLIFLLIIFHILFVFRFAFKELLYYLYTDRSPRVSPSNCLGVMELANRFRCTLYEIYSTGF